MKNNANYKYEFTSEVGSILNDMVRTRGAERYAGIVLQFAADSMGSDTQLPANDTSKNNFMIDHLTGYVWFRKDRLENAEKLFNRAIDDLPNIRFPDEEERDGVLAELYDKLAGVYNETREYEKVVAFVFEFHRLLSFRSRSHSICLPWPGPFINTETKFHKHPQGGCNNLIIQRFFSVV